MSRFSDQLKSLFVGDDLFISYARGDATGYALALANRLGERGLICYLDQYGTGPNDDVDEQVLKKLRASRVLVLIGSRLAIPSRAIAQEVDCFKPTGRAIIPIDVDRAFRDTALYQAIRGLPMADDLQVLEETADNLRNDTPAPGVVTQIVGTIDALARPGPSARIFNRIVATLSYTRRTQLQRAMLWTGVVLLLASVGGALAALVAANRAVGRRNDAERAVTLARQELKDANAKTKEVQEALADTSAVAERQKTISTALQNIQEAARLRNERPSDVLALTAAAFQAAPHTAQSISALASTLQYYRHLRSLMLTDSTDAVTSLTSALNGRLIALVTDQRLILYDTRTQRRVQSPEGGATEISCTPTGRVCAGGRWEGGSVGHFVWRLTATSGRVDIVPLPLPLLPVAPGPYAIADNEQFIAYDSREHKLLAWNLARPADNPRELTCSDDEPAALAVSPGSGTLAYATATRIPSKDGSADSFAARIDYCRLAAAGTDPPVTRFPESTQAIRSLLYSSDGKFLGAAGTGGVWLIDAATNATIGFIKDVDSEFAFVPLRDSSSGIASLTDSERTFQLLVTSDSRRITTWEITKGSYGGERLLKHWQEEYAPGTTSLTTLHDSAGTVLSGGADGAVSFWNFDANPLLESARYAAPPAHRPQVSIRSSRFTSEPDELFLIDPRNPRNRPRPIPIRVFNIRAADLNDDATLLAVVKRPWANGTNIGVELWDLKDLAHPQQLPALYAAGDATAVAFGRDGRVALGYQNGRIGVWDVNARREVAELTSPITVVSRSINRFRYPEVESVAFRPDGKLLASSSRYRPLTLWDVESRTLIWSTEETSGVPLQQHVEAELAFSQDGKKLYSRTNGITKVWDVDPHSWAKRALSIASRTPAPLMSLPVAPVAGLARAQSGAKADPRLGYWRYDSGGFSGNVTGTPSRALYIQTIQGELAVTSCGEYAECLKSTPTLNFLALSGAQVEKSLTVLPDGRLEYRMVARVAQGEASALVYYKRADPTDK